MLLNTLKIKLPLTISIISLVMTSFHINESQSATPSLIQDIGDVRIIFPLKELLSKKMALSSIASVEKMVSDMDGTIQFQITFSNDNIFMAEDIFYSSSTGKALTTNQIKNLLQNLINTTTKYAASLSATTVSKTKFIDAIIGKTHFHEEFTILDLDLAYEFFESFLSVALELNYAEVALQWTLIDETMAEIVEMAKTDDRYWESWSYDTRHGVNGETYHNGYYNDEGQKVETGWWWKGNDNSSESWTKLDGSDSDSAWENFWDSIFGEQDITYESEAGRLGILHLALYLPTFQMSQTQIDQFITNFRENNAGKTSDEVVLQRTNTIISRQLDSNGIDKTKFNVKAVEVH